VRWVASHSVGGKKQSLDPTTTSMLVSRRATSSTGRLRVVKVSGWGLQMTSGSGPQLRSSRRGVMSGLQARAPRLSWLTLVALSSRYIV